MLVDPLEEAFGRIAAFEAVQRAEHGRITLEAVELLQEAAGIDCAGRRLIAERLEDVAPNAPQGAVLLGMLIGLFTADAR
jgi:hypothetical protein